jgi:hypothetical protein
MYGMAHLQASAVLMQHDPIHHGTDPYAYISDMDSSTIRHLAALCRADSPLAFITALGDLLQSVRESAEQRATWYHLNEHDRAEPRDYLRKRLMVWDYDGLMVASLLVFLADMERRQKGRWHLAYPFRFLPHDCIDETLLTQITSLVNLDYMDLLPKIQVPLISVQSRDLARYCLRWPRLTGDTEQPPDVAAFNLLSQAVALVGDITLDSVPLMEALHAAGTTSIYDQYGVSQAVQDSHVVVFPSKQEHLQVRRDSSTSDLAGGYIISTQDLQALATEIQQGRLLQGQWMENLHLFLRVTVINVHVYSVPELMDMLHALQTIRHHYKDSLTRFAVLETLPPVEFKTQCYGSADCLSPLVPAASLTGAMEPAFTALWESVQCQPILQAITTDLQADDVKAYMFKILRHRLFGVGKIRSAAAEGIAYPAHGLYIVPEALPEEVVHSYLLSATEVKSGYRACSVRHAWAMLAHTAPTAMPLLLNSQLFYSNALLFTHQEITSLMFLLTEHSQRPVWIADNLKNPPEGLSLADMGFHLLGQAIDNIYSRGHVLEWTHYWTAYDMNNRR